MQNVIYILFVWFASVILTFQINVNKPIADGVEDFHEELYVNSLPSGHVNTYFQFTTRWHYGDLTYLHNTHLIPRPIAELLLHFDVKELHISLTQGLWRYETWGYPPIDTAPGAEVWSWFSAPNLTQADVDTQWIKLVSTFSGILCSSLNFIDDTNSLEPKHGFRSRFSGGQQNKSMKFLRYASLPREIVCTENLTPWKKLLPCDSKIGFASLLHSNHVHNTNFHALAISMRTICESINENCILEFTQSANLVYDPIILGSKDFSLRRLFGQGLNGFCILAKSSKIYVNLDDSEKYELTPQPSEHISSLRHGSTFGVYNMQQEPMHKFFNIAWLHRKQINNETFTPSSLPPIYAHRYILGHGQERGHFVTRITNTLNTTLKVILQENIPWFVPVYLHTLKIRAISSNLQHSTEFIEPKVVHFIPGMQRVRPYHLEIAFELPAQKNVEISLDFDYIFLKWLEYPPDANHGHYLGSAVITCELPANQKYLGVPLEGYLFAHRINDTPNTYVIQLRTETLILSLPTPDFSMPYNVICLACTVVALAFGPIHSVATKKIIIETKDEPQSLFAKLKNKLRKQRNDKLSDRDNSEATENILEEMSEDLKLLEALRNEKSK